MRVLVTGDRFYEDRALVEQALRSEYDEFLRLHGDPREDFIVVEGVCPYGGADLFAGDWAKTTPGVVHDPHPAEWKRYGRRAGPIRNSEMLKTEPDLVLAFHDNLADSKGTKDMVTKTMKAGITTLHVTRVNGEMVKTLMNAEKLF